MTREQLRHPDGLVYADSVIDLMGDTPLVRLNHVTQGLAPLVLAKVEYFNPGGSVKDRIARRMVEAAEADGRLKPGGTIVEPTSGNTGVGLALVAQQKGYRCVFVCPDKVGEDKRNVLAAYGAEVVVCPTAVPPSHPDSYYSVSDRLSHEIEGAWKPDQYSNPEGPASHYATPKKPPTTPTREPRCATTRKAIAGPTRHRHRRRLPRRRRPLGPEKQAGPVDIEHVCVGETAGQTDRSDTSARADEFNRFGESHLANRP